MRRWFTRNKRGMALPCREQLTESLPSPLVLPRLNSRRAHSRISSSVLFCRPLENPSSMKQSYSSSSRKLPRRDESNLWNTKDACTV